jgi:hypothetical protein
VAFDLNRGYRLNPAATLRPVQQWARYAAALAALADSEVIDAR